MRQRTSPDAHSIGVATALNLAEEMGLLPRDVWIYAISAAMVDCGRELSPSVRQAVRLLAQRIPTDIEGWRCQQDRDHA